MCLFSDTNNFRQNFGILMGRVFYLFFSPLNTRESKRERETETERQREKHPFYSERERERAVETNVEKTSILVRLQFRAIRGNYNKVMCTS